jgi:glucose-1-phosphate thymidylyltransferase
MLVTGGPHAGSFLPLLGNGHQFGIDRLSYGYQDQAGGIAEALGLAERFVDGDPVLVMLADNVMERSIKPMVDAFRANPTGARILLTPVSEPEHLRHLGVPVLSADGRVERIEEKPEVPASNFGVTGIYCYDADVFGVIPTLTPSGGASSRSPTSTTTTSIRGRWPTTCWKASGGTPGSRSRRTTP